MLPFEKYVRDSVGELLIQLDAMRCDCDAHISLQCPEASRWLLITNGDNTYSPKFLETIDPSFDITASPFFSRYWYQDVVEWIAVESSCDMYAPQPQQPPR